MKTWDRDTVIEELQRYPKRVSARTWTKKHLKPSVVTVVRYCGSWDGAWVAAGSISHRRKIDYRLTAKWDRSSILEELSKCTEYVSSQRWTKNQRHPSVPTVVKYFGSWEGAWLAVGKSPNDRRVRWSRERIIQKLSGFSEAISTREWIASRQQPCYATIRRYFDSLDRAWLEAGLTPCSQARIKVADEDLVAMLESGKLKTKAERYVIRARLEKQTYSAIGNKLRVSRQRAQQIMRRAQERIQSDEMLEQAFEDVLEGAKK